MTSVWNYAQDGFAVVRGVVSVDDGELVRSALVQDLSQRPPRDVPP